MMVPESDKNIILFNTDNIKNLIHTVRGVYVMLDYDLAELYKVETKIFNQAVKRNINRFPKEFKFQLSQNEYDVLRSQIVTTKIKRGGRRYLPNAFTEQGVAMLSAVLRSETAVTISIQIMQAFVGLRKFISQNAAIFQRLDKVEQKQFDSDNKFEKIFKAIEEKEISPKQGIFFDGQVYDAYKFVSGLIRKANKSILLIDNYVDDTVLDLFTKKKKNVVVKVFTNKLTKTLLLDVEKFNSQYKSIELIEFSKAHDRFLIIDDKHIYHFGASLKDLGKKWFAFSRMKISVDQILKNLK